MKYALQNNALIIFICTWNGKVIQFYLFIDQNSDTALTIAKEMAQDFYKKLAD